MAQSRDRRNQRRRRAARSGATPSRAVAPSQHDLRRRRLARVVIAFLVLVGLAGVLAATGPADEPTGRAPVG